VITDKENESAGQERIWALPSPGEEAQITNAFFDEVLGLKYKLCRVFGDGYLVDNFDLVIERLCELGVFAYIRNTVKLQWTGNADNIEQVQEFSDSLYHDICKSMPRMISKLNIDSSDFLGFVSRAIRKPAY
jgi:hypothetical protein